MRQNTWLRSFESRRSKYVSLLPICVALFVSLILGACQAGNTQLAKISVNQRYVVATTGIIADVARHIAGDRAIVDELMGPGVDPHLYKATQGDITRLSTADLILYNGLHLEGKMADVLGKLAAQKPAIAVSENIPESFLRSPPEFKSYHDPHIWFDVSLWSMAAIRITEALIQIDSAGESEYRRRSELYLDSLAALHEWVKNEIQLIPESNRILVTAHDAFGYFGMAYDIEVRGLQGISTASEYGLNDVTSMVDMLVERKIKAVFVESSVPRRSIEAVVAGCVARGHNIIIGGELFSDALGAADSPEGSYLGIVRHNTRTIVEALK